MADADPSLLARVLAEPALVPTVQALAPEALLRLVRQVGVEDAGELLALATTEQLLDLLDADAWTSLELGTDETLDAARVSLWLQVLCEAGGDAVAARLAELPFDFVAHALCSQMLVLDADELGQAVAGVDPDEADRLEKALDGCLVTELDGYLLISRGHDGWDALLDVVTALDRDHRELWQRLADRCLAASSELADDSGGYAELLSSAEMLASDAAAERSDRRARAGYVAPSDARAFLALCAVDAPLERDPITAAYFREREPRPVAPAPAAEAPAPVWLAALAGDDGDPAAARPLALGGEVASPLVAALRELAAGDPALAGQRLEELTYLANVVATARRLRPAESATAVLDACAAGLDRLGARPGETRSPLELVRAVGADVLFRLGWPAAG